MAICGGWHSLRQAVAFGVVLQLPVPIQWGLFVGDISMPWGVTQVMDRLGEGRGSSRRRQRIPAECSVVLAPQRAGPDFGAALRPPVSHRNRPASHPCPIGPWLTALGEVRPGRDRDGCRHRTGPSVTPTPVVGDQGVRFRGPHRPPWPPQLYFST